MIESNIGEGRQDVPSAEEGGVKALKKGISITDACVDWPSTVGILEGLAEAIRARRAGRGASVKRKANSSS